MLGKMTTLSSFFFFRTLKFIEIINWLNSLEGGPNGASNSDDAGLEDMVNLANSQLQQESHHTNKMRRKNNLGKTEDASSKPPDNVAHENFLLPINVKRFGLFMPWLE